MPIAKTDSVATIRIMGSGTSHGVPMIGCPCPVCHSTDPRYKRMRCSIFVETPDFRLLVDTPPELRLQAVRENLDQIDAVLLTHGHADHVMGFDDLRRFCEPLEGRLPIHGSAATLDQMQTIFPYAFDPELNFKGYVRAVRHDFSGPFSLGPWQITPVSVPHGRCLTHGFFFSHGSGRCFGYFSDAKTILPESFPLLSKLDFLIIDGLRDEPHPTHLTITEAIEIGKKVQAGHTYLTHLTHQKFHAEREREMPQGVTPVYDGLRLLL